MSDQTNTGEANPAEIVPLRQYKPKYKTEDEIKKEVHKLGVQIVQGSRDLEGTKFAQLTTLAADYVELKMRETNDRSSIKERDIRAFIKANIGYGDANGRVAAHERSSTIEALLAVSAKAAFLYHHGFNGCDIRYFIGTEVAKDTAKGAVPRLAMPFNVWMPTIQVLGTEVKRIPNPDASYRPLPSWAINAQYTLMVGKGTVELDPTTGRPKREATEKPSGWDRQVEMMDKALKEGEVTKDAVLAAASLLVVAFRNHSAHLQDDKVEDALMWLYELLDRQYGGQVAEEEAQPRKRGRKSAAS